jgi:peroxiredoxin
MLRNKTPAPDFALQDDSGEQRSLAELHADKPLVLFFFRGSFCPTSHRDLLAYTDVYERVLSIGADMVAISVDTPKVLQSLRERLHLPFTLLSDSDFAVSGLYGIYSSDEVEEGPQPHGEPAVFILDAEAKIVYSQIQTGPKGHANPADTVLMLLYMANNGGRYW